MARAISSPVAAKPGETAPKAARPPRAPARFLHNTDAPPVVQAGQIALVLLSKTKSGSWAELLDKVEQDGFVPQQWVRLTEEQQKLLEEHAHILQFVGRSPLVTVFACGTCGLHGFASQGSMSAKCPFTLGCDGTVVKAPSTPARAPKPTS